MKTYLSGARSDVSEIGNYKVMAFSCECIGVELGQIHRKQVFACGAMSATPYI